MQQQTPSTAVHHQSTHDAPKDDARANVNPTDGVTNRSSARPPFPTIADAQGLRHGPAPVQYRIRGLETPRRHRNEVEIQRASLTNAASHKLRAITNSGLR